MRYVDDPLVAPACREMRFFSLHRCPECGAIIEYQPAGYAPVDCGRLHVRAICINGHRIPDEDLSLPGTEDDTLDWMLEAVADATLAIKPRFVGRVRGIDVAP